jgi:hypothetical protein
MEDLYAAARRHQRRRRTSIIATGLLLAAMIGSAAWGLAHRSGHHTAAAHPAPVATASTAPTAAVVGAVPVDQTTYKWTPLVGSLTLPVSTIAGPHQTAAGLASGFAHSQLGAVLAAAHIVFRTSPEVGSAIFLPTFGAEVIGPGAAALKNNVLQSYQQMRAQNYVPDGSPTAQTTSFLLQGFNLNSYSTNAAVVQLLALATDADGNASYYAYTVSLTWSGTDWQLVAPAAGTWDGQIMSVPADQASADFTAFDRR